MFNKKLAQLEALYQVEDRADPLQISDFIHYVFENKDEFGLEGEGLSKLWMSQCPEEKAVKFGDKMLRKNGHEVPTASITEGVRLFRKDMI